MFFLTVSTSCFLMYTNRPESAEAPHSSFMYVACKAADGTTAVAQV